MVLSIVTICLNVLSILSIALNLYVTYFSVKSAIIFDGFTVVSDYKSGKRPDSNSYLVVRNNSNRTVYCNIKLKKSTDTGKVSFYSPENSNLHTIETVKYILPMSKRTYKLNARDKTLDIEISYKVSGLPFKFDASLEHGKYSDDSFPLVVTDFKVSDFKNEVKRELFE